MTNTDIIIHDEKDNVGVVVVDKITLNQNCNCWIMEIDKSLRLNAPEIMSGEVEIENGDTLISEAGCSLENIIEFTFKLPISNLAKKEKMLYNGNELKAYKTIYIK